MQCKNFISCPSFFKIYIIYKIIIIITFFYFYSQDKFIHIVSCNTHNIAVIIKTLGIDKKNTNHMQEGRFLCIRRANDISQVKSFIPSAASCKSP